MLSNEVSDRRLDGVVVTHVELARDGSRARLWVMSRSSEPPEGPKALERALAGAAGFLRARLCEALLLKRVPELRFRRDPTAIDRRAEEETFVFAPRTERGS